MLPHLLLLLLGFAFVIKGGDLFVDASVRVARIFGIPRIVIGGTVVSLATTAPELIVSTMASWMGDSGIALGNAVGSVLCNIGLVVGLVAFLVPVSVEKEDFRRNSLWMLFTAVLVIVFSWSLELKRFYGIVLIFVAFAYLAFDLLAALRGRKERINLPLAEAREKESLGRTALTLILGAGLIAAGSRMLVGSSIEVAASLKIPSVVIGLTVVAIGTSLPELVTGLVSAQKGVPDLSIGNIIGANILDLALIAGAAASIRPLTLSVFTRNYSYFWLLVFGFTLTAIFWTEGKAGRKAGFLLLFLYSLYILGIAAFAVSSGLELKVFIL